MQTTRLHQDVKAREDMRRQEGKQKHNTYCMWKSDFAAGKQELRRTKGAVMEKVGGEGGRR